jgi:2-alkyl-3-oxoalkanoate reductase
MNEDACIFVTGAAGFIGRHLVRELDRTGSKIRALVRRPPQPAVEGAAEVLLGDVTRPETYAQGLAGVRAVIHTARTKEMVHDVAATSALYELSGQAGVQKFIQLSSIAVYGFPPAGVITEDTAVVEGPNNYSRAKAQIEVALQADARVPETAILRLGCVYGPGNGWWTMGLLNLMRHGRFIAVDGGAGTANLVYIDDVTALVSRLIERPHPGVNLVNVTDGAPVSWRRYLSGLEEILGRSATVSMTASEARLYGRKWAHPSLAQRTMHKLRGRNFVLPLDDSGIASFASRAVYSIERAVTQLGFHPSVGFEAGMRTVALNIGALFRS